MAGDEHRTIQAGTNSVKVDLQPRTPVDPPLPIPAKSPMPRDGFSCPLVPRRSFRVRLNLTILCWPSR